MPELTSTQLEEYRKGLLKRLETVNLALSKTKALSKIFDKQWLNAIRKEILQVAVQDLEQGFRSNQAFMYFQLSSPLQGASWYQQANVLYESGKIDELSEEQRMALAFFGLDPLRSFLPIIEARFLAFSNFTGNGKAREVERKLAELKANRFSVKFREHAFEIGVLGFFAEKSVLADIEIPDQHSGTIDGEIRLDERSILVEITHTSQELLSTDPGVHCFSIDTLIDQTVGKIRKKAAEGKQLAATKRVPCLLFLALNHLGSDQITARIAANECFAGPNFAKLSGLVISNSWRFLKAEFYAAPTPEVPLSPNEIDLLQSWFPPEQG